MKTLVVAFVVSMVAITASALEWETCLEYLFPNAIKNESWKVVHFPDGSTRIHDWKLTNAIPTQAQLESIEPQAIASRKAKEAAAAADIEKMPVQLKAAIRALLKTVNQRLPAGQKITETELKAAIEAEAAR